MYQDPRIAQAMNTQVSGIPGRQDYIAMNSQASPDHPIYNNAYNLGNEDPSYDPPSERKNPEFWLLVVTKLQEIASFEMAGICIYSLYANSLSGIYAPIYQEMFAKARDESIAHYEQTLTFIQRIDGGRNYLTAVPFPEEMTSIPVGVGDASVKVALEKAISHEEKAIEEYSQLCQIVRGKDIALEDWAMSQVQAETKDYVQFKKALGLL